MRSAFRHVTVSKKRYNIGVKYSVRDLICDCGWAARLRYGQKKIPHVHWRGSSSLLSPLSPLPIKLAYNACQQDEKLILTDSAFNRHQIVFQQSWSHGLLLRITRRFFPRRVLIRRHYSFHRPANGLASLSARENTGMVYPPTAVTNSSTNRAQRSLTLLTWPMPLSLRQTSHLWHAWAE